MIPEELGSLWLRDRAAELRLAADRAERAYKGPMRAMCERVAAKYREAARLLDEEATALEDEIEDSGPMGPAERR